MQFVQDLPALHPWWVDVGFEFAHKKWQCQHNKTTQFTRFLTSWAALDNYKKLRKRLFIKYSLKQQKSKNLFPSSQIPKTQILNSLFPLTFPATKQKNKIQIPRDFKNPTDLLPNPKLPVTRSCSNVTSAISPTQIILGCLRIQTYSSTPKLN